MRRDRTRSAVEEKGRAALPLPRFEAGEGWGEAFQYRKLLPPVTVAEAGDVVLAEVVARLDLDDMQRHRSRIFQPMSDAEWNIGRLVGNQIEHIAFAGDPGHAAHDHPMLRPAVMPLQREPAARIDDQPVDLKALLDIDRLDAAPGTIHAAMCNALVALRGQQLVHDQAQILRPLAR